MLLLIGGTIFAGYFVFKTYLSQQNEFQVSLLLLGPRQIPPGEEVTLELLYENQSTTTMQNVRLAITTSDGFVSLKTEKDEKQISSEAENQTVWAFEDLAPNAKEKLTISTRIVAPESSLQTIKAELFYRPENFNSEFSKAVEKELKVSEPALVFALEGPKNIFIDEEVTYAITYENSSEKDLNEIQFRLRTIFHESSSFQKLNPPT